MTAKSEADQSTSGASARNAEGWEGTHKMATDVNTEELISAQTGAQAGMSTLGIGNLQDHVEVLRQLASHGVGNLQDHGEVLRNLSTQALQNAIETANMVGKQAVRHNDLAIDRIWNVNETDAYATILAGKIASLMNEK